MKEQVYKHSHELHLIPSLSIYNLNILQCAANASYKNVRVAGAVVCALRLRTTNK